MPNQIASHWNATGNVNGYMPKFWGLFLIPLMLIGLAILFLAIPKIDPLKKNIKKFMNYYEGFVIIILSFLLFIQILMILWNIGIQFDMITTIFIPTSILFYYLGVIMPHLKSNWFIGIRTPWTISNDKVWKKTHEKAGVAFKAIAVLTLLSLFFREYAIILFIIPVILLLIYLMTYSYFEYQKEKH